MTLKEIARFLGFAIFAGLLAFFYFRSPPSTPAPEPPSATVEVAAAEPLPFDLGTAGALEHDRLEVQRNETFAEMLEPYALPYARVVEVAEAARENFDVRRLRSGRPYHVFEEPSSGQPRYFVYETTPVDYVVLDLQQPGTVRHGQKPVQTIQRRAEGTISSSLYQTLADGGINPQLAFDLSEVFAWQIDFYRIQKGDRFEVVYQERLVDGKPVGLGKILAARFTHRGDAFYGFYFEQDGRGEYFDEKGQSLRKALLKAPLQYRRISSRYTKRRFHPVQKRWKAHLGTDYAAAPGTPVRAVGDGVVLEAGYTRYNGNWIKIRHNGTYTTGYLHLSRIDADVRKGERVEQGQVIGYVGSTGLATGPHLCYRFWKNGRQIDPLQEELPSSEPVAPEHLMAYDRVLERMLPRVAPTAEGTFTFASATAVVPDSLVTRTILLNASSITPWWP